MSFQRLTAVVVLAAFVGCASSEEHPEGKEPGARAVKIGTDGAVDLLGRPSREEVDAFAARFEEHRTGNRPACCESLCTDAPDLALELYRRAAMQGNVTLATAVVRSCSKLLDHAAYASSAAALEREPERARRAWETLALVGAAPEATRSDSAAAVRKEFQELGDDLGLKLAYVALPAYGAPVGTTGGEIGLRVALSGTIDKNRTLIRTVTDALAASRSRDLTLVLDVERLRGGEGADPGPAWHRYVAELALDRNRPLVALQHALMSQSSTNRQDVALANILIIRTRMAEGQPGAALTAAFSLAEDARTNGDRSMEGQADALAGEALLALDRNGDAAGAFERSAALALGCHEPTAWARRLLNLARAHLKRDDIKEAGRVLDTLERCDVKNLRIEARIALTRAIELAAREEYVRSRQALERAAAIAAAAGDCETVERAQTLRKRLGNLGT